MENDNGKLAAINNGSRSDLHPILEHLQQWIEEQKIVQETIATAKVNGIPVEQFENRSQELLIETKLLVDVMQKRIEQYTVLQYEVLLHLVPQLSRKEDAKAYKRLTSQTIHLPTKQTTKMVNAKESEILKKNFKLLVTREAFQQCFQYLIDKKYIAPDSNKKTFMKIAELQAIDPQDRLIWIHKTKGKVSVQTIVVFFVYTFSISMEKLNGSKNLDYLIPHYFQLKDSEFKKGTLKAKRSAVFSESAKLNSDEEKMVSFILKANT